MEQTGFSFLNEGEQIKPSQHHIYSDEGKGNHNRGSRSKQKPTTKVEISEDIIPANVPPDIRYRDVRNPTGEKDQ